MSVLRTTYLSTLPSLNIQKRRTKSKELLCLFILVDSNFCPPPQPPHSFLFRNILSVDSFTLFCLIPSFHTNGVSYSWVNSRYPCLCSISVSHLTFKRKDVHTTVNHPSQPKLISTIKQFMLTLSPFPEPPYTLSH